MSEFSIAITMRTSSSNPDREEAIRLLTQFIQLEKYLAYELRLYEVVGAPEDLRLQGFFDEITGKDRVDRPLGSVVQDLARVLANKPVDMLTSVLTPIHRES